MATVRTDGGRRRRSWRRGAAKAEPLPVAPVDSWIAAHRFEEYRLAGVPKDVSIRWRALGTPPEEAAAWEAAFADAPSRAIRWAEAGYALEDAVRWLEVGERLEASLEREGEAPQ